MLQLNGIVLAKQVFISLCQHASRLKHLRFSGRIITPIFLCKKRTRVFELVARPVTHYLLCHLKAFHPKLTKTYILSKKYV